MATTREVKRPERKTVTLSSGPLCLRQTSLSLSPRLVLRFRLDACLLLLRDLWWCVGRRVGQTSSVGSSPAGCLGCGTIEEGLVATLGSKMAIHYFSLCVCVCLQSSCILHRCFYSAATAALCHIQFSLDFFSLLVVSPVKLIPDIDRKKEISLPPSTNACDPVFCPGPGKIRVLQLFGPHVPYLSPRGHLIARVRVMHTVIPGGTSSFVRQK